MALTWLKKARFKDGLKGIVGMTLFIMGFVIASEVLKEFLEGRTWFIKVQVPLTKFDLPTITLCFQHGKQLSYQEDFNIWVMKITFNHEERKPKVLVLGENNISAEVRVVIKFYLSCIFTNLFK